MMRLDEGLKMKKFSPYDLRAIHKRTMKCKYVKRYKGIHKPRCCGGDGCQACWDKYKVKNNV